MKLSEVSSHFHELISQYGDIEVEGIADDDMPNGVAERVLRDVDLTLLPDGVIYATAWDLDDEGQGSITDINRLFDMHVECMQSDTAHPSDRADARACLQRIADQLATLLSKSGSSP